MAVPSKTRKEAHPWQLKIQREINAHRELKEREEKRLSESVGVYEPGQAKILFRHWPTNTEWFLLGGPANGDEAQTIYSKYPNVKTIGFEPNQEMYEHQSCHKFPGTILPIALWHTDNVDLNFNTGENPRGGKIDPQGDKIVVGRTLDSLSEEHGPFRNAILWLDIEQGEYSALLGAQRLFEAKQILLVNVELYPHNRGEVIRFLNGHGLREVDRWNGQSSRADYIFALK
jgi:FkbM family methyltransferase